MQIRKAIPEDAVAISALIRSVAHYFTVDPSGKGADRFLESITSQAVKNYIISDNIYYIAAFHHHELAGVAALKDGSHLLHLFVSSKYQRQGLARKLWSAVQAGATVEINEFTVNSTPYAVPFYERLGFRSTGPRTEKNGIAFIPMSAPKNLDV
jgi:GNAT superfamily N-acetyltransferase